MYRFLLTGEGTRGITKRLDQLEPQGIQGMFVKSQSIISAFKRAGFEPEALRRQSYESMRTNGVMDDAEVAKMEPYGYRISNGDLVVTWAIQDGKAHNVHCGCHSYRRDYMSDYYPGFFAHTIKHAVSYLKGE